MYPKFVEHIQETASKLLFWVVVSHIFYFQAGIKVVWRAKTYFLFSPQIGEMIQFD